MASSEMWLHLDLPFQNAVISTRHARRDEMRPVLIRSVVNSNNFFSFSHLIAKRKKRKKVDGFILLHGSLVHSVITYLAVWSELFTAEKRRKRWEREEIITKMLTGLRFKKCWRWCNGAATADITSYHACCHALFGCTSMIDFLSRFKSYLIAYHVYENISKLLIHVFLTCSNSPERECCVDGRIIKLFRDLKVAVHFYLAIAIAIALWSSSCWRLSIACCWRIDTMESINLLAKNAGCEKTTTTN